MVDVEQTKENYSNRWMMTGEYAEALPSTRGSIRYCCPVCGNEFSNPANAVACRNRYFDTGSLCVGDLLIIPNTWCRAYKEDDPWVAFVVPANPASDDYGDHMPRPMPYFVVTAVHVDQNDSHKCVVTVCTLAGGSLRAGCNPANGEGHYEMHRPRWFNPGASKKMYWEDRITDLVTNCEPSETLKEEAAALSAIKISTTLLL
jgi:hypothetical protein